MAWTATRPPSPAMESPGQRRYDRWSDSPQLGLLQLPKVQGRFLKSEKGGKEK